MSKRARVLTSLVMVALIVASMVVPVSATSSSSLYLTQSATAGVYKQESTVTLTSTLSTVCGGDVGIWFYSGNVGLQSSFYRSNTRQVHMQCWEEDTIGDDFAREYIGYFSTNNNVYRVNSYLTLSTSSSTVEDDSVVELYMKFKVDTHSQDTSTSLPSGVLQYRYWVT